MPESEKNALEGLNQAKKSLEAVPSQILPVMKETALIGTGVFRIFSGLDAIYNIYNIFSKEGTKGSYTDIALRGLRVVANLGVIAFSGIAAAAAFGATVIAAPIVGVVLSGITLYKNTADLAAEYRNNAKIKKKIEDADKKLNEKHVNVKQNVELLKDLGQRQDDISKLEKEQDQVEKRLSQFTKDTEPNKLRAIDARVAVLEKSIAINKAINDFTKNNPKLNNVKYLSSTIDSAQTKVNEAKIKLPAAIKSYEENKKLIEGLENLRKDPGYSQLTRDKKAEIENQLQTLNADQVKNKENIKQLQGEITENKAVVKFASQLKGLQTALNDVEKKLKEVETKYDAPYYKSLTPERKADLKAADKEFLEDRMKNLQENISQLKSPEKRAANNEENRKEVQSYKTQDPSQRIQVYETNMKEKQEELSKQIKVKEKDLNERKKYTELFLGPEALKNPPKEIAKQLTDNFEAVKERAHLHHELRLSNIEKSKKWKNIGLGLLGLGIAIAACVPPAQALLALGVIAVGIVSGVNAIYDYNKKKDAQDTLKSTLKTLEAEHTDKAVKTLTELPKNNVSPERADRLDGMLASQSPDKPQDNHHDNAVEVGNGNKAVVSSWKAVSSKSQEKAPENAPEKQSSIRLGSRSSNNS